MVFCDKLITLFLYERYNKWYTFELTGLQSVYAAKIYNFSCNPLFCQPVDQRDKFNDRLKLCTLFDSVRQCVNQTFTARIPPTANRKLIVVLLTGWESLQKFARSLTTARNLRNNFVWKTRPPQSLLTYVRIKQISMRSSSDSNKHLRRGQTAVGLGSVANQLKPRPD